MSGVWVEVWDVSMSHGVVRCVHQVMGYYRLVHGEVSVVRVMHSPALVRPFEKDHLVLQSWCLDGGGDVGKLQI